MSFTGNPNFTWLNALNASIRTDELCPCHGIRKFFASARSTFFVPGVKNPLRGEMSSYVSVERPALRNAVARQHLRRGVGIGDVGADDRRIDDHRRGSIR